MQRSMASSHEKRLSRRDFLILAGATVFSVGGYLLVSAAYQSIGFPLDDAWIHQTYARNLALLGQWSFIPGKASGGSTAPLWSAILAIGAWLKLTPFIWTFLMGAMVFFGLASFGENLVRGLIASYQPRFPWVGAALVLEWHLAWSAGSGMETLLYALLITLVLGMIVLGTRRYFLVGILIGLTVWVRPDGVTLLAAAVLAVLVSKTGWSKKISALAAVGLGTGSLVALYLLFNLVVSGSPLPNTFYAKQAEYAAYLQLPFLQRLGSEMLQPLIGAGITLLPGLVLSVISAIRKRLWGIPIAVTWLIGFFCLYAIRLPVTYQHGRYVIPAIPIFFLLGLAGLAELNLGKAPRWGWVIPAFLKLACGALLVVFWGFGAWTYARDVAVINTEMVRTAKWVEQNLPSDALVAAHDIGALGYFGRHDLVDLAGLINPEVIPFLRDENRIAAYLTEMRVDYLVTFPDWYPHLTAGLIPIYSTDAPYAPSFGEMNMAVYRWTIR